jgi:ABC-type Fe3+ transport system substrate-binding protein
VKRHDVLATMAGALAVPAFAQRANAADSPLVASLVQDANREGRLLATVQASWNQTVHPRLADAFKARFGLTIDVTVRGVPPAIQFPQEIAATKSGGPPVWDVMEGDDTETMLLMGGGGVQPIPRWQELLAAVNPDVASRKVKPAQISSGPFEGSAFLFMANVKQLVYNPKSIAPADLPKTHAELADAKYQGKFVQPPWTAHWEPAPEMRGPDRDKFIDFVRSVGKNTGAVLFEGEGVQRVILGQYAFVLAQDSFIRDILARDPQAPIAGTYFRDYNELNQVYYSVRTRTPHPAGATLWALWMTTPEAEAIWQTVNRAFVPYGLSPIDVATRSQLRSLRIPVNGYLDNQQMIAYLRWQQTPEGARYLTALAKAIRGE